MYRANARCCAAAHRPQQIEPVFQILLVDVDYIRPKRSPLPSYSARYCPIDAGRERASPVIVRVAIICPDNMGEWRTLISEFIHAPIVWNPHQYFVITIGQSFAQIGKEDFAPTT